MALQPNGLIWVGWGKGIFVIKPQPIDSIPNVSELQVRPLVPKTGWCRYCRLPISDFGFRISDLLGQQDPFDISHLTRPISHLTYLI